MTKNKFRHIKIKTGKFLLIAFLSLFIMSYKQEKKTDIFKGYTIYGTVKGIDNVYIKLANTGSRAIEDFKIIDSVQITNGKFSFKGKVENVDMVSIEIDAKYHGRFMLENSTINLDIDVSELSSRNTYFTPTVSGSKSHDQYAAIDEKATAIMKEGKYKPLEEIRELYVQAKKTNSAEDLKKAEDRQKELMPLSKERMDRYVKIKHDFARNNPSSPVAVHVLGVQYTEGRMTKGQLKEFYHLFTGDAKKTGFYKYHITKVYKDNFENMGVGSTAPEFTLNTVEGEELTLSKVNAKYTLVDFWASWCVPCRSSFPHLKELRKKYKAKGFEIIGIGTADLEDKWQNAIKEDKTPWIHVLDESENRAYGSVAKEYGVPHLPTTFLVDENQTILLRNPTKEELDTKLKDLFGF